MNEIQTHSSEWSPDNIAVALNARLDARLVPCTTPKEGMRLSYSHVVVLDNFIGEEEREQLLSMLTKPDWDHSQGPPTDKWERETADGAGLPKTWGLGQQVLSDLAACQLPAMKEVHTRLAKLYPDYQIVHMPSELIQPAHQAAQTCDSQPDSAQTDGAEGAPTDKASKKGACQGIAHKALRQTSSAQSDESKAHMHTCSRCSTADQGRHSPAPQPHHDTTGLHTPCRAPQNTDDRDAPPASQEVNNDDDASEDGQKVECNQFVGNAAVYGDCYTWHVDADPAAFPPSPWVHTFGTYCNGEPGRPLFVSLLLYLDSRWPRQWDAETLFLDDDTDIGMVVRPKPLRAVLMDQDVLHRVSTPSQVTGKRPRYSLVWKLVFIPRHQGQQCCIAKPSWGPPTDLGSAAKVATVKRSLLLKRKAGAVES